MTASTTQICSNKATLFQPVQSEKSAKDQDKVYITHVKQMHQGDDDEALFKKNPNLKWAMARHQYMVMRTILANPKAIFLDEKCLQNLGPEDRKSQGKLIASYNQIFPNGEIPKLFENFSPAQKDLLYEWGGCFILFILGKISHIYKTNTQSEFDNIMREYKENKLEPGTPEYERLIHDVREDAAIYRAKQAAKETGNNNIFIIYGGGHDFKKRIELLNDSTVVFQGEIQTVFTPGQFPEGKGYMRFQKNPPHSHATTSIINSNKPQQGFCAIL